MNNLWNMLLQNPLYYCLHAKKKIARKKLMIFICNPQMASRCPLCRGNISMETLVAVPREAQQEQKETADSDWHSSTKVDC